MFQKGLQVFPAEHLQMSFADTVQKGEEHLNGPEIGPQGIGPAISAVKLQDKFFGRLLARKLRAQEGFLHLGQQLPFPPKLSVSRRGYFGKAREILGRKICWD
jgi:hypothetical protein